MLPHYLLEVLRCPLREIRVPVWQSGDPLPDCIAWRSQLLENGEQLAHLQAYWGGVNRFWQSSGRMRPGIVSFMVFEA